MKKDDYEVTLRRVMCIFLSLEALLICWFVLSYISDYRDSMTLLHYHEKTISDVIYYPTVICSVFVVPTLLSCFFRGVYIFYECLHAVVGGLLINSAILSVNLMSVLISLPIAIILAARLCIYCFLIERHKKKTENSDNIENF